MGKGRFGAAALIGCCALLGCGDDGSGTADEGRDAAVDGSSVDAADGGRCNACPAEAPWACEPCLPAPLQEITATTLDGDIVIAGGFESTTRVLTAVQRFDGTSWSRLPDLPEPRHHVALVTVDRDLYAIGGMEDLTFATFADSWVLRADATEWTPIAPLPTARAAAGAAAIGGRIVVAAGQGPGATATAQLAAAAPALIYDPATDAWTEGAPIPTPREHVASFGYDGELWILGGRSIALEPTLDGVEVYDPATDQWRTGPAMPSPHGGGAATVLDGVAYVGGGEERTRALRTFEALDLAEGTWRTEAPIPTPRHGHAMASMGGRVFVIGGGNEPVFAAVPTVESFAP